MFKFTRIPEPIKSFFQPIENACGFDHAHCLSAIILAFVVSFGRRNVSQLVRSIGKGRSRRGFNDFFNLSHRIDIGNLLILKARQLLDMLGPRAGEILWLLLDDTKNEKRGKYIEGLGYIHDSTRGRAIWGHDAVFITIYFRGYIIPLGVRLWLKKDCLENPDVDFRSLTQLAAELINSFSPPAGVKVRVLFDSFYLCPVVVDACRAKGFTWISTLKNNRNLFRNGRKLKAGQYGRNLFKRGKKQRFSLTTSDRVASYTYVDAGWLELSTIGKARIVFSQKNRGKGILAIATNDPELTAQEIITGYSNRFNIEQFFKDGKQLLGLGQYQNRKFAAAVFHLHLVCFAYALLTHLAITGSSEKGENKKRAASNSIGKLQNDMRRLVWHDLVLSLREKNDEESILEQLNQLLAA